MTLSTKLSKTLPHCFKLDVERSHSLEKMQYHRRNETTGRKEWLKERERDLKPERKFKTLERKWRLIKLIESSHTGGQQKTAPLEKAFDAVSGQRGAVEEEEVEVEEVEGDIICETPVKTITSQISLTFETVP